ncbi:hypothetical protein C8Q80DRAFT_559115 [Daedaleopsis nitida]|nr:hypothetical protein C8Q80DRAFT_559115 [Daedaleopsis nitida]
MNPSAKISTSVSVRRGKPKSQSSKDSTDLPSWTALSNADTADTSDEDETLVDELRLSPVTMYQHPGRQPNSQQPVALNGMTSMPPSTGTTTSRLPPPELAPGSFQPSQPYVIIHDHNLPVSVPGLATATTPSRTSRANLPEAQGTAGLPLQGLTPLQAPISQSNASTTSPLSKRPLKPWEILDEAVFPVRKKPKIAGTSVISFIAASQAPSPNKQQPGSPMKSPNHYGQQTASSVVSSPVALVPESPPQPPSSGPSCQGGRSMDHRVQTRNHRLQKPPSRISDTVSAEWKRVNDALETVTVARCFTELRDCRS